MALLDLLSFGIVSITLHFSFQLLLILFQVKSFKWIAYVVPFAALDFVSSESKVDCLQITCSHSVQEEKFLYNKAKQIYIHIKYDNAL